MKLIKTIIAGIGMLSAILCFASSAQAASWVNDPAVNGIICQARTGGTYPEDEHIFYCGTDTSKRDAVLLSITATLNNYPIVKSKLLATGATFFVFTNPDDAATYSSSVFPVPVADLKVFYNKVVGAAGLSYPNPIYKTLIFENVATGVYPATSPLSVGLLQQSTIHEAGHQFDFDSFASMTPEFDDLVMKDQAYMDLKATSPTASTLRLTEYHILQATPPAAPAWTELFAEVVSKTAIDLGGSTIGMQSSASTSAINPYFKCSQAFVKARMTHSGPAVQADFDAFNTVADPNVYARCIPAPPVCTVYGVLGGRYPVDGINSFICFTPVVNARRDSIFETVKQMPFKTGTNPDKVWDVLKAAGVKVFYFKNKSDAHRYFSTTAPYNSTTGLTVVEPIITTNEECGHTSYGFKTTGQQIVIAVYDECSLSVGAASQISNPSTYGTVEHQAGHAYNYALASRKSGASRNQLPSDAAGFINLLNNTDNPNLVPSTWTAWSNSQKNAHICAVFGPPSAPISPSVIEINSSALAGAVCDATGTPLAPYKWNTGVTGKTPLEIAKLKIPFFMTTQSATANRELWAQEFAELVAGIPGNVFLPYYKWSDQVIKTGSSTQRFVCTRAVLNNYVLNGIPPTTLPAGCPASPGPLN